MSLLPAFGMLEGNRSISLHCPPDSAQLGLKEVVVARSRDAFMEVAIEFGKLHVVLMIQCVGHGIPQVL